MSKIWQIKSKNKANNQEIRGISKISAQKTLKYRSYKKILSANFGNDIILSPSGLAKIESLNSCLSLVRSDFIIF